MFLMSVYVLKNCVCLSVSADMEGQKQNNHLKSPCFIDSEPPAPSLLCPLLHSVYYKNRISLMPENICRPSASCEALNSDKKFFTAEQGYMGNFDFPQQNNKRKKRKSK